MPIWRNSSTKHFCYDEDEDGSEKASTANEIDQGVTCGGQYGMDDQCDHIHVLITFRQLSP
jgi:hypothetical protein